MTELIERAKEKLASLELEELVRAGFKREIESRAHSHQTVTYPEKGKSYLISQEDIFHKSADNKKELALYLNIPFCTGKCLYCHYPTSPKPSNKEAEIYLSALQKEVDLASRIPEIKNAVFTSIYMGGGTPTYLSDEQLRKIFLGVASRFNLAKWYEQKGEFTIEASPETIQNGFLNKAGEEKLYMIRITGAVIPPNRLNIGIQTFDNKILSLMKRRHNSKQAIQSIENARNSSFRNINIDLIVGFPEQTLESWENDLNIVSEMKIPSITTYPLKIRPEAGIHHLFETSPQKFPNQETYLLMRIMAMEKFADMKYNELPIFWFTSSPEYVNKNQIHKWKNNGEMLGLGNSSYSFINNCQYYNFPSLDEYLDSLNNNKLPIWKGMHLQTLEEQATRGMIFGIKCREIDKSEFRKKYGFSPEGKFGENLTNLENLGLIENSEKEIKLTYTGRLFVEEVSRSFIPY